VRMTGKHIAAGRIRPEAREQVGLLPRGVEGAAAACAGVFQQFLREVDQGEVGPPARGVEADELPRERKRVGGRAHQPMDDWGLPITARNSRRVISLERKSPSMVDVTMETPVLCTPRVVMH